MNIEKRAIVMLGVGKEYLKSFNNTFRPSVEAYAKKIGIPTIVIENMIRSSVNKIYWQRFLLFSHPKVAEKDKILMLDSDIYITKHAKNVFDVVGKKPWGACKNNPYDIDHYTETDMYCFESCPKEHRPDFLLNGGVWVLSKEYKTYFEKMYDEYAPKETRGYDMGPLSYFLLNEKKGIILDPEFDVLVAPYIEKYGCSLSSILTMYDTGSFIHFAASKWQSLFCFIRWFDTTDSDWMKKVVRFLGQKKFDSLTALLIKFIQRLFGIYIYRFKKYFN